MEFLTSLKLDGKYWTRSSENNSFDRNIDQNGMSHLANFMFFDRMVDSCPRLWKSSAEEVP